MSNIEQLVEDKVAENKAYRKYFYILWPSFLVISLVLINTGWTIMGWLMLIVDLFFLTTLFATSTDYDTVKKEILEEIEQEKAVKLEAERLEKERLDNIEKFGCAFRHTELVSDDFSDSVIITTKRFDKFKQSALDSVSGVNQSAQLHYNHMTMPGVNIDVMYGTWASIWCEKIESKAKYYLEFHFRHSQRTKDKGWDNKPTAEGCVLDVAKAGENYSFPSVMTRNDKSQYDYNLLEANMKVTQTFYFEVSPEVLRLIADGNYKMRMANFKNRREGTDEFRPEEGFLSGLQTLSSEFCSDLGL